MSLKRTIYVSETRKGYLITRRPTMTSVHSYKTSNSRALKRMVLYILSPYAVKFHEDIIDCDFYYIKRVIRIVSDTQEMIIDSGIYSTEGEVFEQLKTYMEQFRFYDVPETFTVTLPPQRAHAHVPDQVPRTSDGIALVISNIFFSMTQDVQCDIYAAQMLDCDDTDSLRSITDTELETVVYPHGQWGCVVEGNGTVFTCATTVRDLLEWLSTTECTGYFEGLTKIGLTERHKWAHLVPEITTGLPTFKVSLGN